MKEKNILDVLVERNYVEQMTNGEGLRNLLDKEKMERYTEIFEEYEKERKKDIHTIIIVLVLIGILIAFFYFMASYS